MIWKTRHISPKAFESAAKLPSLTTHPNMLGEPRRPLVLAVVGGGPKGYYAIERLVHALSQAGRLAETTIHWFNVSFWFGCGGNFRPDQPEFLLVNNSIGTIDAAALPGRCNLLVDWINHYRQDKPAAVYTDFASRALVGHYLSDTVVRFLNRLPVGTDLRLVPAQISDITASGTDHRIHIAAGAGERELPFAYRSVLLATGHSYYHRYPKWAALVENTPNLGYIRKIYPVDVLEGIPAGVPVAVQGLGLTFIDAVLALTEGRGGIFREEGKLLKYKPSGREPLVIFPFSRSNLPMLPRNAANVSHRYPLRFITPGWAARVQARSAKEVDFETIILPLLEKEMAHAYHRTAWKDFTSDDQVIARRIAEMKQEARFSMEPFLFGMFPLAERAEESPHQRTIRYMKRGLAEAEMDERTSPLMAAAAVWREAVPVIRTLYANGGFSAAAHRVFHQRYYGALNRVAFGPPVENMRKILCLAESGYLRFHFRNAPQIQSARDRKAFVLSNGATSVEVPFIVDARIARPAIDTGNSDLFTRLQANGLATPMENSNFRPGCVALSPDGRLIGADGRPTAIAAYGTPTEGTTLDNDSLSPLCNDLASSWVEYVVSSLPEKVIKHFVA